MSKELDSPFVPTGFAVRAIIPSGTQGLRARLRALGCSDWPPGPAQFARCAQRSAPRAVRLPRSPAAVVTAPHARGRSARSSRRVPAGRKILKGVTKVRRGGYMVGRQQAGLASSPIWALVGGGVKLMPCDFEARRPGALLGLRKKHFGVRPRVVPRPYM